MGKLARTAIAFGERVPVEGVLSVSLPSGIDHLSAKLLEKFGFLDIADKVASGEELSSDDAVRLTRDASFSVLLKLIELNKREVNIVEPVPAVLLPLATWMKRYDRTRIVEMCSRVLLGVSGESLRVSIEWPALDGFQEVLAIVHEVNACRQGIVWVGPALDELIQSIRFADADGLGRAGISTVDEALMEMRSAGFAALRAADSHHVVRFLHAHGFPGCLITDVDQCTTPRDFVRELDEVRRAVREGVVVETWCPGLALGRTLATDALILRALAVGVLYLRDVPFKRASCRFLSPEGLEFAKQLGANDVGFGAVDDRTARTLGLQPLRMLRDIHGTSQHA